MDSSSSVRSLSQKAKLYEGSAKHSPAMTAAAMMPVTVFFRANTK